MSQREQNLGMCLGLLAVVVFAVTLPMTRLATGTTDDPQLSAWFITFGRAALAGALSIAFLLFTRSPWPTPAQRKPLFFALLGNVIGFPLLLGFAPKDQRQWMAGAEAASQHSCPGHPSQQSPVGQLPRPVEYLLRLRRPSV